MGRRENQQNRDHQLIGALFVIATASVAIVIVVVTRSTAGLLDLAPLLVGISNVVLPLTAGRGPKRDRQ